MAIKNMFWKIYSWIFALILISSLFFLSDKSSEDAVIFFFDFFALIGVLSYAYKKIVLNEWFWKLFFAAYLIESIVLELILSYPSFLKEVNYGWEAILVLIFGLCIVAPAYMALYSYAFKFLKA